jgi:hypothetical protein
VPLPVLGVLAGSGLIAVGILVLVFAAQVADFTSRWNAIIYPRGHADRLKSRQVDRVRSVGGAFVFAGLVALTIALFSF